jgi:type II secretory pathway pseudopilin PulG
VRILAKLNFINLNEIKRLEMLTNKFNSQKAITLPEVILVIIILIFVVLLLLSRLPRSREDSRATICLANLSQIGQAMLLYCQSNRDTLPVVNTWSGVDSIPDSSPLAAFRNELQIGDFVLVNAQVNATKNSEFRKNPQRIAGLRCPSDRTSEPLLASNYRGNAGVNARGEMGAFSIGVPTSLPQVEKNDGLSFTAAFSERLIGNKMKSRSLENYLLFDICVDAVAFGVNGNAANQDYQIDAGHDWSRGDWRNTLYHHGLKPNWLHSAIAKKDVCGQIGASSGHVRSVNVLMLDGSARTWKETVDPTVWKRLGGINDSNDD